MPTIVGILTFISRINTSSKSFDLLTPPQGSSECKGKIFARILSYISFPLIWYATWPYSEKVDHRPGPDPKSLYQGSHQLWKSWKTWKIPPKKFHTLKNHGIKKNWIIMEKSWNFVKSYDKTTSSQKTSCQTHKTCVSDS